MDTILRKIIYTSLITGYIYGATVGNIIVLSELLNSGDKRHQQLSTEKKSRSIPDAPVIIAKSHVAPTGESGQSFHLKTSDDIFVNAEQSTILVNVEINLIFSSLEFLPSKPRDPPLT